MGRLQVSKLVIEYADGTEETVELPWSAVRELFLIGFFEGKRVASIQLASTSPNKTPARIRFV